MLAVSPFESAQRSHFAKPGLKTGVAALVTRALKLTAITVAATSLENVLRIRVPPPLLLCIVCMLGWLVRHSGSNGNRRESCADTHLRAAQ